MPRAQSSVIILQSSVVKGSAGCTTKHSIRSTEQRQWVTVQVPQLSEMVTERSFVKNSPKKEKLRRHCHRFAILLLDLKLRLKDNLLIGQKEAARKPIPLFSYTDVNRSAFWDSVDGWVCSNSVKFWIQIEGPMIPWKEKS